LEKIETDYDENIKKNDKKFELITFLNKYQIGKCNTYDHSILDYKISGDSQSNEYFSDNESKSEFNEENEDDLDSLDELEIESSRFSDDESNHQNMIEEEYKTSDFKHFESIFKKKKIAQNKKKWDRSKDHLDIEKLNYIFSEKEQIHLQESFNELCEMNIFDKLIDKLDSLKLTVDENDINEVKYFDLYEKNLGEINYNGKINVAQLIEKWIRETFTVE
jgi:hypothetical protein